MNIEGVYTWEEVQIYTLSAEKAWEKWKLDPRKGYNYKPTTLIKELGITKEEQYHVHWLRSEEVQKERKKETDRKKKKETYEEKYAAKRQKQGKLSREEQTAQRMAKVEAFLKENPNASVREVSKGTELAVGTASKYVKMIRG